MLYRQAAFILILPFSIIPLSIRQSLLDQFDLPRWRGDPFRGFLLKHMQNINRILKSDRIYGPPSVALM